MATDPQALAARIRAAFDVYDEYLCIHGKSWPDGVPVPKYLRANTLAALAELEREAAFEWEPYYLNLQNECEDLRAERDAAVRELDTAHTALLEAMEALTETDNRASAAVQVAERNAHERDFWKDRYDVQHKTVHRLEDKLAEATEVAERAQAALPVERTP